MDDEEDPVLQPQTRNRGISQQTGSADCHSERRIARSPHRVSVPGLPAPPRRHHAHHVRVGRVPCSEYVLLYATSAAEWKGVSLKLYNG